MEANLFSDEKPDQMDAAELKKVMILGSRIPDIILEKSGHFWLRPEI